MDVLLIVFLILLGVGIILLATSSMMPGIDLRKHSYSRISHLHLDLPYFKYTNQLMILNKSTRKEIRENTHLIYPVKSLSAKCVLLRRRYDCTSPSRRYYHRNWLETHRSFGRPRNWTAPLDPPVSLIEADSIVYRLRREYPVRLRRG